MSGTYTNAVKVARMTATRDAADVGGAARIEIGTTGMSSILASIPLANPSGTIAGAGVWTLSAGNVSDTSADNTGTAAEARIVRADGTAIRSGMTVGTTGADINLLSTSITQGQPVTLTGPITLTHAA